MRAHRSTCRIKRHAVLTASEVGAKSTMRKIIHVLTSGAPLRQTVSGLAFCPKSSHTASSTGGSISCNPSTSRHADAPALTADHADALRGDTLCSRTRSASRPSPLRRTGFPFSREVSTRNETLDQHKGRWTHTYDRHAALISAPVDTKVPAKYGRSCAPRRRP